MKSICTLVAVLAGLIPSAAAAQAAQPSHWGVEVSVTPTWTMASQLKQVFSGEVSVTGSELTVGLVRGRDRGGDWGVSYVRKPFKDGSRTVDAKQQCNGSTCFPQVKTEVFEGVTLSGLEVHKYFAFVRASRVQVGLNIAAGAAQMKGNIREIKDGFFVIFNNGVITATPTHTETLEPAADKLLKTFPLLKVEAEGAVLVAPGLKLKVAGGLNFPSYSVRVLAMYLFGSK